MARKKDTSGHVDDDVDTTYFSYSGIAEDIGGNNDDSNDIVTRDSEFPNREVMTMPVRPLPLVLAPPHPGMVFPSYVPLAPPLIPFDPCLRTPSDITVPPPRVSPYLHMRSMSLRQLLIFTASIFIIAFIAAIFSAVYFGHKFTPDQNSNA